MPRHPRSARALGLTAAAVALTGSIEIGGKIALRPTDEFIPAGYAAGMAGALMGLHA